MKKRRDFIKCIAAGAAAVPVVGNAKQKRPNIILMMADDLGAEGLACYNSTIYYTPNLDKMAAEGMLFENAYATPLCTPTRVMVMTGQLPQKTGFRSLISKDPQDRMPVPLKTFGNYFKEAGYATAMAGKWQLGQFDSFPDQPVETGFDEYCMWKWFFDGKKTDRYYGAGIWQNGKSADLPETEYGPDHYSSFVLDFIERKKDQPFFIYYPMALVHSPFDIPPSLAKEAHSKLT
ncbi:MAG: sulfatase-like hydrolase/transferase, partial [Kiritimatiellales bacterium]|nr:sulfatase-like hydrolase/transferase [Kiritimatiellales bacterium]